MNLNYDFTKGDKSFLKESNDFRIKNAINLILYHPNVNGIRNKFADVTDILTTNNADIFFLSETKIDESFTMAQFHIPGFKSYRADRNSCGGGVMAIDIPHCRRNDVEKVISNPIEYMVFEFVIRKDKWWFTYLYNPNIKHKMDCCDSVDRIINVDNSECINSSFIIGDLIMNMLCNHDRLAINNVLDVYNMKNIIISPTCFKSRDNPPLLDVILTISNTSKMIADVINVNTEISDFHHLIGFSTRLHFPKKSRKESVYRSYRNLDELGYKQDMSVIPYHVGEIFDDIDDQYWFTQNLYRL